jgi:hypothetical protein
MQNVVKMSIAREGLVIAMEREAVGRNQMGVSRSMIPSAAAMAELTEMRAKLL